MKYVVKGIIIDEHSYICNAFEDIVVANSVPHACQVHEQQTSTLGLGEVYILSCAIVPQRTQEMEATNEET